MRKGNCKAELLEHDQAHKSPGDFVKERILVQKVWDEAQDSKFPSSPKMMEMLLVHKPHLENQEGR